MFSEKLSCKNRSEAMTLKNHKDSVFVGNLMGRELTIAYTAGNKTLQFITKDADVMNLIKMHFHGQYTMCKQGVKVSTNSVKEYNVSFYIHLNYLLKIYF